MIEKTFTLGTIVVSTQGRDKDSWYVVVGDNQGKILVADGKYKLLAKPKSKNVLHLRSTNIVDQEIATKLSKGQKVNDQMIYHTLYEYKKGKKGEKDNG